MVQSLRLHVYGKLTPEVRAAIASQITPAYLRLQLVRRGVSDRRCTECGTTTYKLTEPYAEIPTSDLTLRIVNGDFYGSASGAEQSDKLVVKAVALKGIQNALRRNGIRSRMNFADVDASNYERLARYELAPRKAA